MACSASRPAGTGRGWRTTRGFVPAARPGWKSKPARSKSCLADTIVWVRPPAFINQAFLFSQPFIAFCSRHGHQGIELGEVEFRAQGKFVGCLKNTRRVMVISKDEVGINQNTFRVEALNADRIIRMFQICFLAHLDKVALIQGFKTNQHPETTAAGH